MSRPVPSSAPNASSLGDVDPAKNGIPAATLIIFEADSRTEHPRLLFVERSLAMRFAPGAVVWPGGRVDDADRALAADISPSQDIDDIAARIAAIRETVEETGLLVGIADRADTIAEDIRDGLSNGRGFANLLSERHWRLDIDRLSQFARWDPKFRGQRAFDTRFYITALNADVSQVKADGIETHAAFWASAKSVIDDIDFGRRAAIFPTIRNLERIAGIKGIDEARTSARKFGHIVITPQVSEQADGRWLTIAENAGYPVTKHPLDGFDRK